MRGFEFKPYRCKDCKRWRETAGIGNRRRCPASGQMHWAGDDAEYCHFLILPVTERGACIAC